MWENWLREYGYLAIFFGAMFEGEAVLIVAGYSVARGYLEPLPSFLLAAAGAATVDSVYFWVGRSFGARLLRGRRKLRPVRARATLFLRRHGHRAAFLTRFAWGLRLVLPMLIGAVRMRPAVFHPYAAAAALCFSAIFLSVGYAFGQAIADLLLRVERWEAGLVVAILVLGAMAWVAREWWIYRQGAER